MAKPKGAGDLRQRVKFQRRRAGSDADGNAVEAWEDLGVVRACSLTPTRGGEDVQAGRIAGWATWDCWVRSDDGTRAIEAGDRAVNVRTDETFNIAFVGDMDGRRTWLLIQMTSGGVDG